jgi:ABC-type phosphate transport system substrate-binding protein
MRLVVALLLLALPACAASETSTITAAGSTTLLPLVRAAAADYILTHPDVKITVSGGGSAYGIAQVARNAVDLGDSDVPAKDLPNLVDHLVAVHEHIFTNGQSSAQVAGFINFIENDALRIRQLHFIPISAMKTK